MKLNLTAKLWAMSKLFMYVALIQGVFATFAFATNGRAQSLEEVTITMEWDQISLEDAFQEIQSQTDFFFTYDYEAVKGITISNNNEDLRLSNLLRFISGESGLAFSIFEDNIFVSLGERNPSRSDKPVPILVPIISPFQELAMQSEATVIYKTSILDKIVRGTVQDMDGNALVGATIMVKGSGQGTVTDDRGAFSIAIPDEGNATLIISYVGYALKEVPVNNQSNLTISLVASAVELEGMVVRGYRKSLANALAIKEQSVNAVDAIVAEDIAKFPQSNVSEALQRISGIQIRRDYEGGVGNEVSVRGLPPEYTQVTLNGQAAPNSSDTRTFNFNALPAELYGKAEVIKSPTADMDEGGIGGVVNLVTRKPFDIDDRILVASLEGIYNTQAQDNQGLTPKASLTFGQNWNNKFGILGGVSYFQFLNTGEGYDNVRYEVNSYDLDGDMVNEFSNILVPFPRYVSQGQEVERLAVNLAAQYEVSESFNLLLEGTYVKNDQVATRYTPIWFLPRSGYPIEINTDGPFFQSGTYEDVLLRLENQQQENITDIYTFGLTGKWNVNDWNVSANATYQANNRDSERYRYYADNVNRMSYSVEEDLKWFDIQSPTDLTDASQFEMAEARRYMWENADNIISGQVDVTRSLSSGFDLDFGAKLRSRNKTRKYFYNRQRARDAGFPTDFAPVSVLLEGFLDNVDEANGPSEFLVHDWDKARSVYEPIIPFNRNEVEQIDARYDITEDITAGYVMGTLDKDKFDANFGVRLVNTKITSKGFDLDDETGALTPRETTSDYLDVLPSINLRYALGEKLYARAAFARVMSRPSLGDLSAYREIDDASLTIAAKNPELDPFRANQYDLGLEWYPKSGALIGVSFFRKDIESFITNETVPVDLNGVTYLLSRPVNGNEATINGLELNFQQPLTFLPSPFDGLGVVANYTISDSDFEEVIDLETGESESYELPNNSKHSANAILYYEKYGFQVRFAFNYRSNFLRSKPNPVDGLKYRDDYSQTDISAGYDLTDNISLTLNILNAFNANRFEYIDEEKFQDTIFVFGRTFQVGARFSLK